MVTGQIITNWTGDVPGPAPIYTESFYVSPPVTTAGGVGNPVKDSVDHMIDLMDNYVLQMHSHAAPQAVGNAILQSDEGPSVANVLGPGTGDLLNPTVKYNIVHNATGPLGGSDMVYFYTKGDSLADAQAHSIPMSMMTMLSVIGRSGKPWIDPVVAPSAPLPLEPITPLPPEQPPQSQQAEQEMCDDGTYEW